MTDQPPQNSKPSFTSRLMSAINEARHLPQTLRLVWAASKSWTVAWVTILLLQGLLPVAVVYLVRAVVNTAVEATEAGGDWPHIQAVLIVAVPLGAILLLLEILRIVVGWIRTIQAELVSVHIASLIQEKSANADLAFYETTAFHDLMYQARYDAAHRPLALLENMGGLLQSSVTLIGMGAVLIPISFWLPLVLMVQTVPAFFTLLHFAQLRYAWRTKTTPVYRRSAYFDSLLTSANSAAEVRTLGTKSHFQGAYKKLRNKIHVGLMELKRRESLAELGASVLAFIITAATMAWVVWKTLFGSLLLGDLVLFYQAFNRGQQMLRSLLGNTEQVFSNLMFIGKLFEYLALEPKVLTPAQPQAMPPLQQGIQFNQVGFRYPGTDRFALENLDLKISAGQTVAILGPNGSGKSTVIKLLCRLYDPDVGTVTMDGTDLRNLDLDELRSAISPLFQAPVHYIDTAGENIALGNLQSTPTKSQIEAASRAAGAHEIVARLPGAYDCLLGKEFKNGTELSGGEWQRIALARAFLRPSPLLLLDEPTSAMDSWAEADWLDRFQELAKDRTAVIVTHRLSTAMRADIIFVMENGRVAESGSHRDLLAKGGLYADSWTAQTNRAAE